MDSVRSTSKLNSRWLGATLLFGLLTAAPAPARADANRDGEAAVREARKHLIFRRYDKAIKLLKKAQKTCLAGQCETGTRANIYLIQGLSYALKRDVSAAQKHFEWALQEDPNIKLDPRYVTRRVKGAFDKAKSQVESGSATSLPVPAAPRAVGPTAEQKRAVVEAKKQLQNKDWEACLQTMIVATSISEFGEGKLTLARCQDQGGLLLEARRDAEAALELVKKEGNNALVAEIKDYLEELDNETPKIVIANIKKVGVRDAVVKIDGQEIPKEKIDEPIDHNPGTANIQITGKRGGTDFSFTKDVKFQRKETLRFDLAEFELDSPFQQCMKTARTAREERACKEKFGVLEEGLNLKAGLEVSSYNDNDNVDVLSPALFVAAVQPTQGWNVGASVIVDVVTTASADIVSTASRRFDEVRVGGSLGGGYKIGPVTAGLTGGFSTEPDYLGRTVGMNARADLFEKMVSPIVSYSYGFDTIGRSGTSFDIFSRDLQRHTINAGASIVFDAATIGAVVATAQLEFGDSSKPYRYVPMFPQAALDANVFADGPAAPSIVAALRSDVMPLEQLPSERQRYAVLLRGAHRFDLGATVRASERLYMDSWGQMASTTDARFYWDLNEKFRLGPHARFHYQGPVDFWQKAYAVSFTPDGVDLPDYRTGDRELGPLFSGTLGTEFRASISEMFSMSVYAEGIYTRFLDHLFLYDRWGVFTATTAEVEFK